MMNLAALPASIIGEVLSFIKAEENETVVALVDKSYLAFTRSTELWYLQCLYSGKLVCCTFDDPPPPPSPQSTWSPSSPPRKILSVNIEQNENTSAPTSPMSPTTAKLASEINAQKVSPTYYRSLYRANPHVPLDYPTIAVAMKAASPNGTVVLNGGSIHYMSTLKISKNVGIKVFPVGQTATLKIGAQPKGLLNQPLIVIESEKTLTLSSVALVHHTRGQDIWSGNCAILINGGNLLLSDSSVLSSSGRGIVVIKKGTIEASNSTVHDCAATGIYVGDSDSICTLNTCNVVRNGVGGPHIPPGHSGIYIESSKSTIEDCYVRSNSLTGVTVVRGGAVVMRNSCIYENGAEGFTTEDTANRGTTACLEDNYIDGMQGAKYRGDRRVWREGLMSRLAADEGTGELALILSAKEMKRSYVFFPPRDDDEENENEEENEGNDEVEVEAEEEDGEEDGEEDEEGEGLFGGDVIDAEADAEAVAYLVQLAEDEDEAEADRVAEEVMERMTNEMIRSGVPGTALGDALEAMPRPLVWDRTTMAAWLNGIVTTAFARTTRAGRPLADQIGEIDDEDEDEQGGEEAEETEDGTLNLV